MADRTLKFKVTAKPEIKYELEIDHGGEYGAEEERALLEVLANRAPSCGKKVFEFEEAFARYCGTEYALTCTSATTGLQLAGIAAGVGPDTEVITTPISWIATSTAFSVLGARIVFCDVDRRTLNLDPQYLERLITKKTRAIVPVHMAGQCAQMDEIVRIADKYGIPVIEDVAHSPGAGYRGRRAGNLGAMGVFSFHQQKNMSTLGEGGMVTTNDRKLFERVLSYRSLCARQYLVSPKYLPIDADKNPMGLDWWRLSFDDIGYNYRMTDAQAAVGIEQLKRLDGFNRRRTELAAYLTRRLSVLDNVTLPWVDPEGKHVWHFYLIQLSNRHPLTKSEFMYELFMQRGIKPWNHYMPIHLSEPYRAQGHREGECPVAEDAYRYFLSLPLHPRLTQQALDYMADVVIEMSRRRKSANAV